MDYLNAKERGSFGPVLEFEVCCVVLTRPSSVPTAPLKWNIEDPWLFVYYPLVRSHYTVRSRTQLYPLMFVLITLGFFVSIVWKISTYGKYKW